MIYCTRLGIMGRLGNQLFQYAFLRTQAEILGVKFFCPKWIGDEIFNLNDSSLRAKNVNKIKRTYKEPAGVDYNRTKLRIEDNSDIFGNFQSEKNFDKNKVRGWYSFKEEKIKRVKEKYSKINFSKSVGIHLRLGDKFFDKKINKIYYVPRLRYYIKALKKMKRFETAIIFSDNINIAKKYFRKLNVKKIYIENNKDWEDLYLMSICRDFICGVSTLSWWGAWLINNPDKIIVHPSEGTYRTGVKSKNSDLIPKEWIKIRSLRPLLDDYRVIRLNNPKTLKEELNKYCGKVGIILRKCAPFLYRLLKPYFPDRKMGQE